MYHQRNQQQKSNESAVVDEEDFLLRFEVVALATIASIFLLVPKRLAHVMFTIQPDSENENHGHNYKQGSNTRATAEEVIGFCISLIGTFQLGVLYLLLRHPNLQRRATQHLKAGTTESSLRMSACTFREMFILLHTTLFLLGLKMKTSHPSACKDPFYFFMVYHLSASILHAVHHRNIVKEK